MSDLILLESFDWCSDAQLSRASFNLGGSGRTTGRTQWGWSQQITATLPGAAGTGFGQWTCGMAVNGVTNQTYMQFINDMTFGHPTIKLVGVGDGTLYVDAFLAGSDTSSDPSTFVMHSGGWYYLEMQAQGSIVNVPPSGSTPGYYYASYVYTVVVNGSTTILSGTIQSPHVNGGAGSGGANFRQLTLGGDGEIIDDVYLTDTEFLGDISVQTLFPNADGTETDWTPFSGTDHYAMVDEHNPGMDDDTTYNASGSAGQIDLYSFQPLVPFTPPSGATGVMGVQLMSATKKDDTGDALVTNTWQMGGGSPVLASPPFPPSETYLCQLSPARKSVFTGSDWTQTEVNTLQAGVKRVV